MHRLRDDRGAVAVLVAILVPVVLLGCGALVLDFGALYAEKRQLQNGADAAALAVARSYAAAGVGGCVAGAKQPLADGYADNNANDPSGSNIDSIACPASNKVKVTTSTNSSNGSFITPVLAQVLGAGPTTVHANATAAWGAPSGLTSLPLTISACEFNYWTTNGSNLAPPPPYPPYPSGYEKVIQFHNQDGPSPCPTSQSGADLPGGFGWLRPSAGTCSAATDAGNWVADSTGAPPPNACDAAYLHSLIGTVIDVPVYDHTNGLTGNNGTYHLKGYAAFFLTGYYFTGGFREQSVVARRDLCSGNQRCLYGFFTKDLTPTTGTVGTGPNLGVTVVQLTD